jgi:valyl-tRNA synthetase
MKLSDERLEGSRNFANKLWNMGRLITTNLGDGFEPQPLSALEEQWPDLELADRWIVSRHNRVTAEVTRLMDAYQYGEAGRMLHEFLWSELADWYLEAAKIRLYGDDEDAAATVRQILYNVFERSLRLLHPFMPYVTEAIWGHLPRAEGAYPALIVSRWPEPGRTDEHSERVFSMLRELVRGVRNARAEYDVEPGHRIAAIVSAGEFAAEIQDQAEILAFLARLDDSELQIGAKLAQPEDPHVTVVVGEGVECWLPLAGMVDLDKERRRLGNELEAAEAEVNRLNGVLANEQFVSRAPEEVVQRERDRLAEAESRVATLAERIEGLGGGGA